MINPQPVTLALNSIRLEPLSEAHLPGIQRAASDGELWSLWYTGVPSPDTLHSWFNNAMAGQERGEMLCWAVRDTETDEIVGSTRYHDIVAAVGRVEIGYTFYAQSRHRSAVNTSCKLLLLEYAFDSLGCNVVGLRTDQFNFRSQRAIEALGAKKDGVIRCFQARPNGTPRDTVMYSIIANEWPDVKRHLEFRLARHSQG